MNQALIVVDAQNEFSSTGLRPVPNHASALAAILEHVASTRAQRRPIAWVQHHNRPTESRAFVPESWGAAFSPGLGPQARIGPEAMSRRTSTERSPTRDSKTGYAQIGSSRSS